MENQEDVRPPQVSLEHVMALLEENDGGIQLLLFLPNLSNLSWYGVTEKVFRQAQADFVAEYGDIPAAFLPLFLALGLGCGSAVPGLLLSITEKVLGLGKHNGLLLMQALRYLETAMIIPFDNTRSSPAFNEAGLVMSYAGGSIRFVVKALHNGSVDPPEETKGALGKPPARDDLTTNTSTNKAKMDCFLGENLRLLFQHPDFPFWANCVLPFLGPVNYTFVRLVCRRREEEKKKKGSVRHLGWKATPENIEILDEKKQMKK